MKLAPGVVIGERYVVERRVGTGAMGEVWAGTRLADGLPVALKVLLTVAASDQESIARFRREAQVLARVRSEYVSQVLDFLTDEEMGMTLVMELIPGDSMHVVLWREKRLPLEMMVPFCADVLHGLRDLHASGIVHRDLKPGNIVVRPMPGARPRATLIDFGVSRIIAGADEDEVTAITRGDRVLGTLEYMAPEQILSSRAVTFTADLYALGAVMFKALSGGHVFGDLTEGKLAMAKLNQDAPPLDLGRDDTLATRTCRFVARLLARRSRERFGSTEEALAEALRLADVLDHGQTGRLGADIEDAATMMFSPAELQRPHTFGAATPDGGAPGGSAVTRLSAFAEQPAPVAAEWAPAAEVEPPPSSRVPRRPPPLPGTPSPSPASPVAAPVEARPEPERLDATVALPELGATERAVTRPVARTLPLEPAFTPRAVPAPSAPRPAEPAAAPSRPQPRRRARGRWRTPVVVVASLTLGIVGGGFFSRSYAAGGTAAQWVEQLRTLFAGESPSVVPTAEPSPTRPPSAPVPVEPTAAPSAEPAATALPSAEPSASATSSAVAIAQTLKPRGGRPAPGPGRLPGPGSTGAASSTPSVAATAAAPSAASPSPPPTAAPPSPPMPTGL